MMMTRSKRWKKWFLIAASQVDIGHQLGTTQPEAGKPSKSLLVAVVRSHEYVRGRET